jgi:hypothetical protein
MAIAFIGLLNLIFDIIIITDFQRLELETVECRNSG